MKPPFPYYGSKTRVADKIVALLPAHRIYLTYCSGPCYAALYQGGTTCPRPE